MFATDGRLHAGGFGLILLSLSVLVRISEEADFILGLACSRIVHPAL